MTYLRYIAWSMFACLSIAGLEAAAQHPGDPIAGRELFERVWESRPGESGPLGPLYNERSCVACHRLGAIGGAGLNARNVELVSVEIPESMRLPLKPDDSMRPPVAERLQALNQLHSRATSIHSGLRAGSVVLHAYGVDPRYAALREQVLGLRPTDLLLSQRAPPAARPSDLGPIRRIEHKGATLLVSARNSTAMFGAGLIDRLSIVDIKNAADEQAERHPEMKGRLLGRFGWRGQTLTLRSFVAGACGVELGLDVPQGSAAESPVTETLNNRRKAPSGFAGGNRTSDKQPELDDRQFSDLVAFVASLPTPGRREAVDEADATLVRRGEAVFESTQCAVCHLPSIGNLTGLYSDLLLHDLGPGLYDPQPAPASLTANSRPQYYDVGERLGEFVGNRPYEWRTPPLWGLADSGPYLHDGRALTVEDAIEMHGGQAESSVRRFRELPDADRRALRKFLSSLVAPDSDYLKKPLAQTEYPPGMHPQEKQAAAESAHKQLHAERAARGRLQLASLAFARGETESARNWLASVVRDFPNTQAASEATARLNPRPGTPAALLPAGINR